MAVTLTIGEQQYEVAPFKLKGMRAIAGFVEKMNEIATRIDASIKAQLAANPDKIPDQDLGDLFALSRQLCEIIAVGLEKIDPTMTADWLEDQVDLSFLPSLQEAARELLAQSGLSSKNAKAPSPSQEEATGQELETAEALGNSSPVSSAS